MALIVRRADLALDRVALLRALEAYLGPPSNEVRFDWLYHRNPFGEASAWLMTDGDQGLTVGVAAFFPRLIQEVGRELAGCVLGDFCLAPAWRSLGPGLQLQRACLQGIATGEINAGYDFPSAGMLAIYRRLRYQPQAEMVRMAKPLRVDRKVRERVGAEPAATAFSALGNRILRWRDEFGRRKTGWSISPHEGEIGEEFTDLARRTVAARGTRVMRTASYLRWRFREHPYRRYQILAARRENKLYGYVVLSQDRDLGAIVDLLGENRPEMLKALVQAAVDMAREHGSMTLSASLLRGHAWTQILGEMGFHEREAHPVMICSADRATVGTQWYLTDGDRES